MATAPVSRNDSAGPEPNGEPKRKSRRRKTSHLKEVPQSRDQREHMKQRCAEIASQLDKQRPLTKDEMEVVARELLADEGMPERFVGWVMVMLASEFWRDQVAAVPPSNIRSAK